MPYLIHLHIKHKTTIKYTDNIFLFIDHKAAHWQENSLSEDKKKKQPQAVAAAA